MSTINRRGMRGGTFGIETERGTYTALGYRSVRVANREGRSAIGGSGDYHSQYDRGQLINQSREFFRDNGIYRGMIDRAVGYIVGNGFAYQAKTSSKAWNDTAEALWKEYWRRPEIRCLLSGRRVERMACRELLLCGDTTILKLAKGLIQQIEAEQMVGQRNLTDGIEKDDYGRPKKFWIGEYGRGGQVDKRTVKGYQPEYVLFLCDPERPSATRGVPPCQATFAQLHRINDVCDSEAIAWQMLARLAVSITRKEGATLGFSESKADPDKAGSDTDGHLATRLTELDYALIFHGEPDEEIKGIERNLPGKNFSESLIMFLRLLGLPLGLPLEVTLLDWTKSNYSQSRAVLEQAYAAFLGWQLLLEDFGIGEIVVWKIDQWVREGKLQDRPDKYARDFIKPTFPWIDQLKEAQAYGAKLDRNFISHAMVCKSLNNDRDEINAARKREVLEAIKTAREIEKKTGQKVPWEIFAGLEAPAAKAEKAEKAEKAILDNQNKRRGNDDDEDQDDASDDRE